MLYYYSKKNEMQTVGKETVILFVWNFETRPCQNFFLVGNFSLQVWIWLFFWYIFEGTSLNFSPRCLTMASLKLWQTSTSKRLPAHAWWCKLRGITVTLCPPRETPFTAWTRVWITSLMCDTLKSISSFSPFTGHQPLKIYKGNPVGLQFHDVFHIKWKNVLGLVSL